MIQVIGIATPDGYLHRFKADLSSSVRLTAFVSIRREPEVPAYRLYYFGPHRVIDHGRWVAADSDEDAVTHAEIKKPPFGGELWDRDRLVAEIDPPA